MTDKKTNYCATDLHQYCLAEFADGDVCTSFIQNPRYSWTLCGHMDEELFCTCLAAKIPAAESGLKQLKEDAGYKGEKVHAEPSPTGSFTNYYCPQCKDRQLLDRFNFCPDCGVQLNWEGTK